MSDSIRQYLKTIEEAYKTGLATEHTYRAALEALMQSQLAGIVTINEPKRIACGAPDLTILKDDFTIGYIEAKDIGISLDEAEKSEQLKRYRNSLENLILTDYLEFRWYVKGEHRYTAKLGTLTGQQIKRVSDFSEIENLFTEFLAHGPEPLKSSLEVAQRMAKLTHMIRTIVMQAFEKEQASYLLKDLRQALAQTLLPDLDQPNRVGEFADIYAQTIAYGLFAARCNHKDSQPFRRSEAATEIPKTNPFLRRLFAAITGPDFNDEPYVGFVKDLVQLLATADMEAILSDFGRRTRQEDPIVHFYETFLATYDPRLRELRGVYYTPEPVVSYIVRSVDHLLKDRFNLPSGLADISTMTHNDRAMPRMLLLDPAVGTGTFLYGVIDHIRNTFRTQGNVGMWSGYVRDHLLRKLYGFELLMVPYAVAHFKLALQLAGQDLDEAERQNWAYDFGSDERLKIYLTNTLEEIEQEVQKSFGFLMRAITEEAQAAAEVKQDLPILVVMGNPPYSYESSNTGKWISELVREYYLVDGKPLGERNPKGLQDDYVKFIRWGQWRIERSGAGILAFITNHGYLNNPTFRGMRQHLMNTFTDIYLLDLHGNAKKKETTPDGSKDENVFDIQQGVAIGIFIKEQGKSGPAQVYHADLWGKRESKYEVLVSADFDIKTTEWATIEPESPFYLFTPQKVDLLAEYQKGCKIIDSFLAYSVGISTARDKITIQWTTDDMFELINEFSSLPIEEARSKYNLGKDSRDWKVSLAQEDVIQGGKDISLVRQIFYRPFDIRYTYFTGKSRGFQSMPRPEIMQHLVNDKNLALCTNRQVNNQFRHVFVSQKIIDGNAVSLATRERTYAFPLYLYPDPNQLISTSPWPPGKDGRTPNLNPKFVADVEDRLGLTFSPEGAVQTSEVLETSEVFTPEDIFNYIYAIFHSPTYRDRYAEFLKIDFPRVSLTRDRALFAALVNLGQQLVKLHLLEQVPPSPASYPVTGDDTVAKGHPRYNEAKRRVYINQSQYFEGIEPEVWDFYVGGYQVLDKWLKDRRGRQLSYADLSHYQKIVAALQKTIELMAEIDNTIPNWPIE